MQIYENYLGEPNIHRIFNPQFEFHRFYNPTNLVPDNGFVKKFQKKNRRELHKVMDKKKVEL